VLFKKNPVPAIGVRDAAAGALTGELELIDVREPRELAEVRVQGARNIPLGEVGGRLSEFGAGSRVAFLCRSGSRSARAVAAARAAGLDAVNVDGGVIAWARANLPLVYDSR